MTIKEQWNTIKNNWLLAVAFVVIILIVLMSGNQVSQVSDWGGDSLMAKVGYGEETAVAPAAMESSRSYMYDQGFAPEVEDRKITKTASITNEVERGTFKAAEIQLKSIITATDSFLLNENVGKYGEDLSSYYTGNYQIKVESGKYDAVVSQLKAIGEVTYFNENAQDITERYTSLETELAAEKERMQRYQDMYKEAVNINDKIELSDRIFNQERTVKYLEEALAETGQKVEYSTLYLTLTEKQSEYVNIALVKFSQLLRNLVDSFNSLLALIFSVLPYAVVIVLGWFGYRFYKKKKK